MVQKIVLNKQNLIDAADANIKTAWNAVCYVKKGAY